MKQLALVTCKVLPEPDPDQEILLEALAKRGIRCVLWAWDDWEPRVFDSSLCVLRSCWNYHEKPSEFLSWIAEAERSSRVLNPPAVLRWNLHKRYLHELEEAGIPIIPTAWFQRGESPSFERALDEREWDSVVVKPAVSAGSFRTRRFGRGELAQGQEFLGALVRERDVMMQPFLSAFEDPGERALIWIDGQLTHAVRKHPRFAGGVEQVSESLSVTSEEVKFARDVLSHVKGDLLYARLDLLSDGNGGRYLSELELIEPSLYFLQNPAALNRFVDAIQRRLG